MQKGHLISRTPVPQQSHKTIPSGDAPINGYLVGKIDPESFTVKFVCLSAMTSLYFSIAVFS